MKYTDVFLFVMFVFSEPGLVSISCGFNFRHVRTDKLKTTIKLSRTTHSSADYCC